MLRSPPVRGRRPNMQHPIMRDCVLFLPFNEGTGEVACDLSGNSANATLTSGSASWESGFLGHSQHMESDTWTIPYHSGLAIGASTAFTWSWWMRRNGLQLNYSGIWENSTDGDVASLVIRFVSNIVQIRRFAEETVGCSQAPADGEWEHWCLVKSGRNYSWYVNGVFVETDTMSGDPVATDADNRLGIYHDGTQCNCNFSNWMLFRRAVSAVEVQYLYRHPWCMYEGFRVPILVSGASTPTTISVTKGEVLVNALQPTLNVSTKANVTVGRVLVTSRPVSINAETSMSAGVGRVLVNALQPTLTTAASFNVGIGRVVVSAKQPTLTTANAINVGIGRVLISALQPTVTATGDTSISVGKGQVLVSALQPTINAETICNVTVGTVRVTSRPVSINAETFCNVTVGTVVVSALSIDFSDGTGVGELMLGDVSVRPTLLGSAMINTNNRLWISEDNNVKLTGLRLDSDASYVNDATASFVVTGTTGNVIGSTGTTMSYTTGTNGNYLGVFPSTDAANLAEDTEYYVAITASSSNNDLYRKHKVLAAYHGFEDV